MEGTASGLAIARFGCAVSKRHRCSMRDKFEELAVVWLCRSFEQKSPTLVEVCVEIATICDALAILTARLDAISPEPVRLPI